MTIPKRLISIGEAWVDPEAVIGIDSHFSENEPAWANVRVTLSTGQVLFGAREPGRVAAAVRGPDQDRYDEAAGCEEDGAEPTSPAERARRRHRRPSSQPSGLSPLRPLREDLRD